MDKKFLSKTFSLVLTLAIVLSNSAGLIPLKVGADGSEPKRIFYSSFIPATWSSEGWSAEGQWHNNNNDHKCETKQAEVKGDTGDYDDYLTKMISTATSTGYNNIVLSFWYRIADKIEHSEYVKVQWYNGSSWADISGASFSGNETNWKQVSFNLPSGANNNPNFGFRFAAKLGSSHDIFRLDCVELRGTPTCTQLTFYQDSDNDTYGNPSVIVQACSAPQGYVIDNTDCNDLNDTINPGATEICDGIDNDCDGSIDEGGACSTNSYYCDTDEDTYISATPSGEYNTFESIPSDCTDQQGNDCNDNDATIHPSAIETCNGEDDDCDNQTDEGVATTYYQDNDNDSYGNSSVSTQACSMPTGYVTDNTDCNDSNSGMNPGATEICGNGTDEDCSGSDLVCSPTTGSLTICKYEDKGTISMYEEDIDTPLVWGMTVVYPGEGGTLGTQTNGETGCITISDLFLGEYSITENSKANWVCSYPDATGAQTANITAENPNPSVYFLNYSTCGDGTCDENETCSSCPEDCDICPPADTGTVEGHKYNDLNCNGILDEGEPALGGWNVFLDYDKDSVIEDGEPQTTSSNDTSNLGFYHFLGAPVGSYQVCEILDENHFGWAASTPLCQPVTVTAVAPAVIDFLNCQTIPVYNGEHTCPQGTQPEATPTATVSISSQDADGETITLEPGTYLFRASGVYYPLYPSIQADAGYRTSDNWTNHASTIGEGATDRGIHSLLSDMGTGKMGVVNWGDYNGSHTYDKAYTITGNSVKFVISDWYDGWYDNSCSNQSCLTDNFGDLNLKVYRCASSPTDGGGTTTTTTTAPPTGGGGGAPTPGQFAPTGGIVAGATTERQGEVLGAACELYLLKYIKLGADNDPEEVKKLESFLNEYLGLDLPIDGVYDKRDFEAVKQFQLLMKDKILGPWVELGCLPNVNTPTGYVYKTTKWAINSSFCPELYPDLSNEKCYGLGIGLGRDQGEVLGETIAQAEEGAPVSERVAEEPTTELTTETTEPTTETTEPTTETITEEGEIPEVKAQTWLWVIIIIAVLGGAGYFLFTPKKKA